MTRPARGRRRALRFGFGAEAKAAWLLRLKGYRILARRFKTPGGEADIVAFKGGTLVFVEVKARASLEDSLEAIRRPQMTRIASAARAWLARHPADMAHAVRFDAIFIAPRRWPLHIVQAFEVDF